MMYIYLSIKRTVIISILIGAIAFLLSSCGNVRRIVYMQGTFDTAKLSQLNVNTPVIRKGDLLNIVVYSDNPAATALYNQTITGSSGSATSGMGNASSGGGTGSNAGVLSTNNPSSPGYQVDDEGNIQFQGLGQLHVEGLTRQQLKDTLNSRLKKYLDNPYYTIRFLNYRFTMLGEVNRPGLISIPGEHVNLFEAIGLAGDLTFYGRRDNVLVIRENNGKREFGRLDLTKPEIMASPYFYLQQNDVVIVEPDKKRAVASDQVTSRNVTIAATIVSTLAIVYSIFK